jgi:hypothetical protein
MVATNHYLTKLEIPRPIERTVSLTASVEVDVDDLPAPLVVARPPDVAELFGALRYQLHRAEAQVVSAGRELIQVAEDRGASSVDRALHLVTASVDAVRAALRALDVRESRHRASGSHGATRLPSSR